MLFDIVFHILSLNIHTIKPINRTKWWIIKVKNIPRQTYEKISIKKINNIILFSSFVIYIFCVCHSGSFSIVMKLL